MQFLSNHDFWKCGLRMFGTDAAVVIASSVLGWRELSALVATLEAA